MAGEKGRQGDRQSRHCSWQLTFQLCEDDRTTIHQLGWTGGGGGLHRLGRWGWAVCVHWVNLGVETKRMLLELFSGKSRKRRGGKKRVDFFLPDSP